MAERKSQNKYYPPDWDPSKGPLNRFIRHKSIRSHLTPRPKKLPSLGSSVRFELPFTIQCLQCHVYVGMGVRFNAKKNDIGSYLQTTLYQFRMKCHECTNWFDIRTDPQSTKYIVYAGAREKIIEYDPVDIGLPLLPTQPEKEQLQSNVFLQLERGRVDLEKKQESIPTLTQLLKYNHVLYDDSFSVLQRVKKKFKSDCGGVALVRCREGKKVEEKYSLSMNVLPESKEEGWKGSGGGRKRVDAKERLIQMVVGSRKDPFSI
jgi:coiled-coil domain-containing protein 130